MPNGSTEAQQNTVVEQEQTSELSVSQQLLPQVIADVFGSLAGPELNNFDGDSMAKFRLTALATGPTVKSYEDSVGKVINVRYFYVHPVRLDGKTPGEFVDALRCVLIEEDLTAYGFVSEMLAKDLARMVRYFGLRPWEPTIAVRVTKTKGNAGRYFYNLVPTD